MVWICNLGLLLVRWKGEPRELPRNSWATQPGIQSTVAETRKTLPQWGRRQERTPQSSPLNFLFISQWASTHRHTTHIHMKDKEQMFWICLSKLVQKTLRRYHIKFRFLVKRTENSSHWVIFWRSWMSVPFRDLSSSVCPNPRLSTLLPTHAALHIYGLNVILTDSWVCESGPLQFVTDNT